MQRHFTIGLSFSYWCEHSMYIEFIYVFCKELELIKLQFDYKQIYYEDCSYNTLEQLL